MNKSFHLLANEFEICLYCGDFFPVLLNVILDISMIV